MHAPTHSTAESSPLFKARMAGFLWLMTIITGMFGFIAGGRFMVPGDAATTAANIVSHESLYRWSFIASLIATVCYLGVTVFVYQLFRPVNRTIAVFGVFVSLMGCGSGLTSAVLFLAPLDFLGGAQYLTAFTAAQLQAQALAFFTLSLHLNDIGMVFFGCHVLSIGLLIRRSTFLPRFLGALLTLTAICYWTNSLASFLDLSFKTYLLPFVAIGGLLGEGALTGWFLAKGVNLQRWNEEAATKELT